MITCHLHRLNQLHRAALRYGAGFMAVFALLAQLALAGEIRIKVTDGSATPLADAVLFADADVSSGKPLSANDVVNVDQIDRTFVPRINVIRVGQSVLFPNSDNIRHHVYSFSKPKVFQIELYEGVPKAPIQFPLSGVVVLGCNIHDSMVGYIVVAPGDVYTKTGADGKATLQTQQTLTTINIWHPALSADKSAVQRLELPAAGADGFIHIALPIALQKDEKKPFDKLRSLRRAQ